MGSFGQLILFLGGGSVVSSVSEMCMEEGAGVQLLMSDVTLNIGVGLF